MGGNKLDKEKEAFEKIRLAILDYDEEAAEKAAKEIVAAKMDPLKAMDVATETLRELGKKFEEGEIYLPHLVMAADAMKKISSTLTSVIPKGSTVGKGTIILATVEGDIHDIGKSIVSALLTTAGYQVVDLGRDVPARTIVDRAEEVKADIIATSSLMSVTMPKQKDLEEELRYRRIREKYKTMVGGAPTTADWAEQIGADGHGRTAIEAVATADRLMREKRKC